MQLTLSVKGRTLADDTSAKEVSTKHADKGYDYPLGLVGFSYTTENTSDEISLVFVTDLKPNQVVVRKYNPTDNSYKAIDGAKVTKTKVDGKAALKVTYTIEDNGPLDLNPAVGEVTDPVGLTVSTIGVSNTGAVAQSTLPVAIVGLTALATVATAVVVTVRRKS